MTVLQDSLLLLLALGLVLLNGFFVASEFAIVKLRQTRVKELARVNGWRGRILRKVHKQLDAYLSACQLGITLASLGLGWVGEPAFAELLEMPLAALGVTSPELVHTIAFIFAFAIISYLHIVIGELAPKSLALRKPEQVSLWTATPLYLFYWAMYPFIWVLNASSNSVLRMFGLGRSEDGHGGDRDYSPEELGLIVHHARQVDEGPDSEIKTLMAHILELDELEVGDLMRPRREMVVLDADAEYAEVRRTIKKHQFSRYPLRDPATDDFLGVVHVKDVLPEPASEDLPARLRVHTREAPRVGEHDPAMDLLRAFRRGAPHFALVEDENQQVVGFLTMEDIFEAIFGEISDEHEQGRANVTDRRLTWLPDGRFLVRGDTPAYQLERAIGSDIPEAANVTTVAGLLMSHLDRVPVAGDIAEFERFTATVRRMRGPRIELIKITPRKRD